MTIHILKQFYSQKQQQMIQNYVSYQNHKRLNSMHTFTTRTNFNYLESPYSTFCYDPNPFAKSQFTCETISNSTLHAWAPDSSFTYDCFDIKKQKCGDLLGAVNHLQKEQSNPFDINLKIPSMKEFTPFANFLSQNNKPELSFFLAPQKSLVLESSLFPDIQAQISNIEQKISLSVQEQKLSMSIFANPQLILNGQLPNFSRIKLWQEEEHQISLPSSSLIYSVYEMQQTDIKNKNDNYFFEYNPKKIQEKQIITKLILALQGIQNYPSMTWSIKPQANFMISFYYKESISNYISAILELANIRSKLQVAVQYIATRYNNKDIYTKILKVYSNSKYLLDSLLMSYIKFPITFLDFLLRMQPIKSQLQLLLTLLIRQSHINQLFCDFNHSYIHGQNEIFKFLFLKLSLNDNCEQDQKDLIRCLGISCFDAILFSLNIFLHYSRQEWESSSNQHFYFGLLFEERKQYVDQMIQKLHMVRVDDMEIYGICKEKRDIKFVIQYSELKKYQFQWKNSFKKKVKLLKAISKRIQKERQKKLEVIIQKKAAEIAQMKLKLMQRMEATSKLKSEQREKQKILIEDLRRQIEKKVQSQKLLKLIQIQKEKGYLLDAQIKQRDILLDKKYKLLAQNPQLINRRMQIQQQNVSVVSLKPKSMMSVESHLINMPSLEQVSSSRMIAIQKQIKPMNQTYRKTQSTKQILPIIKRSSTRSHFQKNSDFFGYQQSVEKSEKQQDVSLHLDLLQNSEFEVPIKTALQICVYNVVKDQVDVLNQAYRTILYHKYRLDWIFQFLHDYILSANGEHMTELVHLSVDRHSLINISCLKDYFFNDSIRQEVSNLKPMFYRSDSNPMIGSLNLIQITSEKSLQVTVGLEFHYLPQILKPIFNYIHMAKYMEIFSFILRIRHCVRLLEMQWKDLQIVQRKFCKISKNKTKGFDISMLKKLFDIRNKIQCFFNIFQNYFYFYVVEKEFKVLQSSIRKYQIDDLSQLHNSFLEAICRKGFIQAQQEISVRFKKTFLLVKQFHNIVNLFCSDDIATYAKPDVQERLRRIGRQFVQLHRILQEAMMKSSI